MATFFIDYQQLVMQAYERKKANNALPHGLMHLTPAKLKDECVKRCTNDVSKRDEKAIRDFCGDLNESKSCHVILQRCDTDKFRPLVNYLKGKSEKPGEKNIELLAWLIDFPGRPWENGKTISGDERIEENPALDNTSPVIENEVSRPIHPIDISATEVDKPTENPVIPENPIIPIRIDDSKRRERTDIKIVETNAPRKTREKSTKTLAAAVMLSLVVGTGGMWWWKDKIQPPGSGTCMFWQEDHYEPVACNKAMPNVRIVPLDSMKLKYFRKITSPDTITYQAIGKVWYSKIKGKMEYYTLPGEHPVVFGYQLRPITAHMIEAHILSGVSAK
ncbi:hypothetical protein [Chitinophaga varians]|uniref:hypothetical protein n=1 Tax=Chitinophaga varians TaxID=2202339 RepID=UPI00165FF908|nr:hypothetical protein [Chitinophaga varians]MBC9913888.1 hypothetical protein [Chitinophaga varians]